MPNTELPLTFEIGSPAAAGVLDPGVLADQALLARNLNALGQRQPALARRLANLGEPSPLRFEPTEEDGALTAEHAGRALASRRRPLTEARRLADKVDIQTHGGLLVLGMGLGHHVAAIAARSGDACALVVFEPDLALLRAVLERIDHTAWLGRPQSVIVTDPDNVGALTADLTGLDALLSVGIELVEHAPNAARIGDRSARMIRTLTGAVGAMRMHVITAMVQADVTARNELMNIGHYVARPGIADLKNLCEGRPAILVAAGPSLRKSIELLKDPRVRERCVVIAVQTVLKPLLEAGITPHFVTAIDYHEISKRFYEGLTPDNVEGVTLVAEARANAAILDAFPGDIRLPRDDFLDDLLKAGPRHDGPDRGKLIAAATVAHLSYYLARHLGADPVVLVGQDLAFTDAQYYGQGAAIHNVWACELNEMHTLETLEWQRIVRNKGHLHRVTDVLGRPVFTDDQMAAYLAQFERDFAPDQEAGRTVIDASEGVRKRHTTPRELGETLADFFASDLPPIPEIPRAKATDTPVSRRDTANLLRKVRTQTRTIARKATQCVSLLEELLESQHDAARNREIVHKAHALREDAQAQQPAFHLLMKLNQLGGFKRFKADRAIALADHDDKYAEQRARIERDLVNLEWIEQYAGVFEELLGVAENALKGGPKRTRDVTPRDEEHTAAKARTRTTVGAVIHTGLGAGDNANLVRTIERLRRVKAIDAILVLSDTPERCTDLQPGVTIEHAEPIDPRTRRALRAGRAFALDNWRGGLAGLSAFDEALDPRAMLPAIEKHALDAVLAVGPDWVHTDPELTSAVIERHLEAPASHPVVFAQAPPGLCPALLCAQAVREMAQGRTKKRGSMFASLGGVLGYVPLAPRHDPIARPGCVQVDERVRDRAVRAIADADAELVRTATDIEALHAAFLDRGSPTELALHADTIDHDAALAHIASFASTPAATLCTVLGEPERLGELVHAAKSAGLLTHVRTHLRGGVDELLACGPDVVSVDCVSAKAETYERLTGVDAFPRVQDNLEALLAARELAGGLPTMWLVPRITKRDDVYEDLEAFYDLWMTRAGAAVIDPLPRPIAGERIAPLALPGAAEQRLARRRLVVGGGAAS